MKKTILSKDLKIGMYVVLPVGWFSHPFVFSEFLINTQQDIDKIIEAGITECQVDEERSFPVSDYGHASHGQERSEFVPPKTWNPEALMPPELREAIQDKCLPAEEKATRVYKYSLELMRRLFEDPKSENIKEAKKGISEIVDLIIADNATAAHLLRLTSYDFYTYTHSVNVGVLSVMLAKALFQGSDAHDMHELGAAFFLHDIGKTRIDPAILNKPGKLTDEEMKRMRAHPYQGYKILVEAGQLSDECAIIVMQHHERDDGKGYPRRLKGGDIHPYGRIGCVADVFDAITAERSYKPKVGTFEALKIMKEQMLSHFHADVFEKFVLLFTKPQ